MGLAHEIRGLEFKGPGRSTDRRLFAQVVKAVLGMANRRDGGRVVVGVEDLGDSLHPVGLDVTQLATWNYDDVADRIATYADPSVAFDLEVTEYNGRSYVVIQVEEFADVPVLCKRAYDDVLRDGACYVRPRRKPETTEIPTYADMRDLLDLAVEKGVRRLLAQVQRVGLTVPPDITVTDQERFDEQLGDLR
jgi:predicted HTH transcriptional regulator